MDKPVSNPSSNAATAGAQSLRRALSLLRLLAEHQEDGITLTEVMAASGLERSTAHRLLSCLAEEQFAERDPDSKSYRLGIDAMQLGFASMRRVPLVDNCKPLMQKLARMSGSGATCFGVFDNCGASAAAAKAVSKNHPDWWVRPTVLR